jgi:hypothetical protein
MGVKMKEIEYNEAEDAPDAIKKLKKVEKSKNPNKKFDATFIMQNGKYRTVSFGAADYDDFTLIKDDDTANKKRELYIKRHEKREKKLWDSNPATPAALSRWILWEKRDLDDAIKNFKSKFNI